MRKIVLFSIFLIIGLIGSQTIPAFISPDAFGKLKAFLDAMLYICLAFIMINVGREFELDKTKWKSYTADYFIAMATAAVPWLLICGYFILLMPAEYRTDWNSWKETLLLSRFAAPTSAGILFTMLAAALRSYKHDFVQKYGPLCATDSSADTPFDWVSGEFKWPWEA